MKMTGTSAYVKIEYEGRIVKASGELIVGGFVALKNSMTAWEEPDQSEELNSETREKIIDAVLKYCIDKDFKVQFE
jgi:hypothetical protein